MICMKSPMNEMPPTCMECSFTLCPLPLDKYEDFRPECHVRRHINCPLIEVKAKKKEKTNVNTK